MTNKFFKRLVLVSFFVSVFSFSVLINSALAIETSAFPENYNVDTYSESISAPTTAWEDDTLNGVRNTTINSTVSDTITGSPLIGDTASNAGAPLVGEATSTQVVFPTGTGLADPSGGIKQILTTFLSWLLGIFGILALISFVISGSMYLLAAGDDKMIERAKSTMTFSIIGVIIALSGFILIRAIDAALNASSML